jgi:phosphatidylglycerol lysyltransferase
MLSVISQFDYYLPAASYARALLAMSLSFLAWLGWTWYAMPRPAVTLPTAAELQEARQFYSDVACTTYSYLSLMGDKYFYWTDDRNSLIQYGSKRNHLIALGDPACTAADLPRAIQQFRDYAADYDLSPVFYQVEEVNLHHYHDAGFRLLKLGESARVQLQTFTLQGKKGLKMRQALNRGERDRLQFELLEQPLGEATWKQLRAISNAWLGEKKLAEIGFSLGCFDRDYLSRGPVAVIRIADRIIAFASVTEDFGHRQEFGIDLMRHASGAPHGAMDFLFVCLLRHAHQAGYQWFDLGMAPLSGVGQSSWSPRDERLLRLVYRFGDRFYNYQGLRHYKEKFQPQWRGMYLAYPRGHALAPVLLDLTALITGGYRHVISG